MLGRNHTLGLRRPRSEIQRFPIASIYAAVSPSFGAGILTLCVNVLQSWQLVTEQYRCIARSIAIVAQI